MGNCNETPTSTTHGERIPLSKPLVPEDELLDGYGDRVSLERRSAELKKRENDLQASVKQFKADMAREREELARQLNELDSREAALNQREIALQRERDALKLRQIDFAQKQIQEANKKHGDAVERFEQVERQKRKEQQEEAARRKASAEAKAKARETRARRSRWKRKQKKTEADEFVISAPSGFTHASHVGFGADGSFDVVNAPDHIKRLLEKAGVQQSKLDRDTASFVFAFMNNYVGQDEQQSNNDDDDDDDSLEQLEQLVPVPKATAPPPPLPPSSTAAAAATTTAAASVPANDVAAPLVDVEQKVASKAESRNPKPLPVPPPAPPPTPAASVAAPPPSSATSRSGDAFTAALQQKRTALKQVDVSAFKNLSVEQEDSLAGALARALADRRGSLYVPADNDTDDEYSDDSEDWSDE